jgi:hypothetical protein
MSKNYNEIPVKDNMKVDAEVETEEGKVEKPKMKKVVHSKPTKVKRSLVGRLVNGVMGPEGIPSIGSYVNDEIIKPAVKNIIYDAITSGLSRALNLDYRHPKSGHQTYGTQRPVNYANRSHTPSSRRAPHHEERKTVRPSRYGVEDYVIEERYDAAHVLTTLTENADMYDNVSVADYYDLIGVASNFTDNSYGWTIDTITQASILPVQGGYIIKFPPVEVI